MRLDLFCLYDGWIEKSGNGNFVGFAYPLPPVLYSTTGIGWLTARRYCMSRFASAIKANR